MRSHWGYIGQTQIDGTGKFRHAGLAWRSELTSAPSGGCSGRDPEREDAMASPVGGGEREFLLRNECARHGFDGATPRRRRLVSEHWRGRA